MHKTLISRGVSHLYHFTDSNNIGSIINTGGLLSAQARKNHKLSNVCCGGNEWSQDADRMYGLDRYVHLCFIKDHPLEYLAKKDGRINQTCWLEVSIEILKIDGVLYSPGVANKNGVPLLTSSEAISSIDLCGIYDFLDFSHEENKLKKNEAKKSEVLVPEIVPLRFITNIDSFR